MNIDVLNDDINCFARCREKKLTKQSLIDSINQLEEEEKEQLGANLIFSLYSEFFASYAMMGMRSRNKSYMPCNRPMKSWRPGKKRVVKACSGGREKIIHFGASGYGHNYSPTARRSFRARHKCGTAKDKLTARHWACKNLWTKGGSSKKPPARRSRRGSPTKKKRSRRSPTKKKRSRR